ncbi:hypothetical protein SynROS8604_01068 [Synechococcus sp. ROS8604]|nr:hypothetical protein SynROS8604_01068 [Synechococcus sp. ROS8604]
MNDPSGPARQGEFFFSGAVLRQALKPDLDELADKTAAACACLLRGTI